MAVRILSNEVSDICIGKPAARSLPSSATIADAILALKLSGEAGLGIWSPEKKAFSGRIFMADIICFLCADENIAYPAAALHRPLDALLPDHAGPVFRVERHCSLIESLDLILAGAQSLMVPLRSSISRRWIAGGEEFCWLTREDFLRYFLDSINLFSPTSHLTIAELGLVRRDALVVRSRDPALSALTLFSRALAEQTSVAIVSDDGHLVGEISPSALSTCDESAAAALAVLSAGEFMAYIDCGGCLSNAVNGRLREKGMAGMLELLECGFYSGAAYSSSSSSSSSSGSAFSSSSDEEAELGGGEGRGRRGARMRRGRRSKDVVVCQPESTVVAVILQALAYRVSYVWVVDEDDDALVGVVAFSDILQVFREQLRPVSYAVTANAPSFGAL